MDFPLVISFYTPSANDYYRQAADNLRADCAQHGLACQIDELPDLGSWIANCRQKPAFLLRRLTEEQRPLLWIDVDLRIHRTPDIAAGDYDIGLVRTNPGRQFPWHAGVIALMPTPATVQFLVLWERAVAAATVDQDLTSGDHSIMIRLLQDEFARPRIRTFPREYCWQGPKSDDCYIHFVDAAKQIKRAGLAGA